MILLGNGKSSWYQWDINQRIIITDIEIDQIEGQEIHFSSDVDTDTTAQVTIPYVENGIVYAPVPNILLTISGTIHIYLYISNGTEAHTEVHKAVKVVAREKPSDYVYTETEVKTWEELNERLKNAVYYTPEERTEEEKAQARENIGVPQSDYTQNDSTKPDYVKNRPCYEDVSINITWDGDTTDRIAASDSDYLVSYDTPSSEDLIGASYTSYNYGERTFVLTADSITYPVENLICVSGVVFIALDNNVTYEEKTFPAKGTYFHKTSLYRSISLYKGTLKKLDPKFIDTDSLPKELLKVTVLYDASTGYSADKTYLDISNCLENGGIPYIALYKGVSTSGMSEIITYCGLSGQGYVFINADSGNGLIVKNNNIVLLVSSDLKLELDKTVKTESQTLSESQKDQARANIGAAETAFGITGASVGQIIKIKAIDDSGVPTGWEVCNSETWTFTLNDGSTVTKEVYVR